VVEGAAPCILVRELKGGKIQVFSPDVCLPNSVGAIIGTDSRVQRLQKEELAKAKGILSLWLQHGNWTGKSIEQVTDLHIWTAIAASLHNGQRTLSPNPAPTNGINPTVSPIITFSEVEEEWNWSPPDLSEGGDWYKARVVSLRWQAISDLPNPEQAYRDGLEPLKIHQTNYGEDDIIHRLQLLW
jgi:hypothetical protein